MNHYTLAEMTPGLISRLAAFRFFEKIFLSVFLCKKAANPLHVLYTIFMTFRILST